MNLYVIAGHGAGDPGACANGATEAERVRALARRIKELGGAAVALHDVGDDAYASGALNRINVPKGTGVVELHMDSAGAGARGAHVIIKQGYAPDAVDNALAEKLCAILPGRSQKIAGRSDLANPNRAAARGINYRLVEVGFITSPEDLGIFNGRMDEIAAAILSAFGIGADAAPAPQPAPQWSCRDLGDTSWTGPAMVSEWQAQLGTSVDGAISGQSAYNSKTVQWAITVSPPANPAVGSRMVIALQGFLNARGFGAGGADGHMGEGTVRALQAFLNDRLGAGLDADGMYGHATSRAVGAALLRGLFR